jgi:hypothetical protein
MPLYHLARLGAVALVTLLLAAGSVQALGLREAEAQVAAAYADYRAALFQTNQRNRAATESALDSFAAKWQALATAWRLEPPPQYAADPALAETLDAVARVAVAAREATARSQLAEAHEILEEIRDLLAALRARNGVVVFSDRMNAYHALMEKVIEAEYGGAAGLAALRDDVAVLLHLARDLAANRPHNVDAAAFDTALRAVLGSVEALHRAAAAGDAAAIGAAREALKAPYSRMFLRFG